MKSTRDHNNYREQQTSEQLRDNSAITCKMPTDQHHHQRVHHRDLGLEEQSAADGLYEHGDATRKSRNGNGNEHEQSDRKPISYSAIVNKSIMNKLAWGKSASLLTTASKAQHNNNINNTAHSEQDRKQFSQTMYRMTSMQLHSSRRYSTSAQPPSFRQHSRKPSTSGPGSSSNTSTKNNSYKLMTPSLIALILASSLLVVAPIPLQAAQAPAPDNQSAASPSTNKDELKPAGDTRRDSSGAPSSAEKNSIVASLSSAVASAAAAAAVAAAKNSLSAGDARSLLSSAAAAASASGQQNNGAHQQQRSPGFSLALKLADSIPEVPYSILHNMKKLDHAAPFYNVPGRASAHHGTAGKESSPASFLVSALTQPGALGGAADQLAGLFRSPLWKRIADGYGEFTSEFRSLFRARPTTMKGPSSSTSKLVRDISMPVALMLLASAIPSDWRPTMKNRRKSSPPEPALPALSEGLTKLANGMDPMGAAASESLASYSPMPQQFNFRLQPEAQSYYSNGPAATAINPRPQFTAGQYEQQQQQHSQQQIAPSESVGGATNWMSPSAGKSAIYPAAVGQQQQQQASPEQQQPQTQPQVIKRVGESVLYSLRAESNGDAAKYQQTNLEPVNIDHHNFAAAAAAVAAKVGGSPAAATDMAEARDSSGAEPTPTNGLFSSLTSSYLAAAKLPNAAKLLMNKIMNANGAIENHHYQLMAQADGERSGGGLFSSLIRNRDHHHQLLSDKHRYSLVEADGQKSPPSSSSSARPFSLSSVLSKAASRILSSPLHESGSSSGSSRGRQATMMIGGGGGASASASADRTINLGGESGAPPLQRRESSNGQLGQQEQRDLTQLLPQSWREAVKRTVNSVKQEASTQWRSIEGQLANWVQDKLKTLPMTPSQPAAAPAPSTAAAGAAANPAAAAQPVANLIASVSSTAMNMLGLGGRNAAPVTSGTSKDSSAAADSQGSSSSSSSNKNDSSPGNNSKSPQKTGALASVASMIVNTLTNRQPAAAAASTTSQKQAANVEAADQSAAASSSSSSSNLISQYPTLTGAQPSSSSPQSTGTSGSAAR